MTYSPQRGDAVPTAIPESTLRRMPAYLSHLKHLAKDGVKMISSSAIASELGLNPVQVRKDLAMTAANGRPKTGYEVGELQYAIESFLGYNKTDEVLLVGAGNLGQTLLSYDGFSQYGMRIVVAFDNDPQKVGTRIGETEIFDIERLENLAPRLGIRIGILTVPTEVAQTVCNRMVRAGIVGIWNFSATRLQVPADVVVQNENISASFAVLTSKLNALNSVRTSP